MTVTEPIYRFVKGKGWEVENFESITFEHSRRTFCLEKRHPRHGENYVRLDDQNMQEIADYCP
jgi:hypothetical protein